MNYVEKLHVPKWVVQLHMKNTGNKRTFVDYKLFKLYKIKRSTSWYNFLGPKKKIISPANQFTLDTFGKKFTKMYYNMKKPLELTAQMSAYASDCPWHGRTLESSAGSLAAWSPPAHTGKNKVRVNGFAFVIKLTLNIQMCRDPSKGFGPVAASVASCTAPSPDLKAGVVPDHFLCVTPACAAPTLASTQVSPPAGVPCRVRYSYPTCPASL